MESVNFTDYKKITVMDTLCKSCGGIGVLTSDFHGCAENPCPKRVAIHPDEVCCQQAIVVCGDCGKETEMMDSCAKDNTEERAIEDWKSGKFWIEEV